MDINSFVIGYKKGKASGGGGGGSLEGFHMVRFFNDDQTTLLYTVFVPTGADVIYAGETPISTEDSTFVFKGFEPSAENITADFDCYATYVAVSTLDETSWKTISELSEVGLAEDYFAVGDTKMIHIEGTVGTVELNGDYGVYIIGFDHNKSTEGTGIHFGTFKTAVSGGKDIALCDENYNKSALDGSKWFSYNHWGNAIYSRWKGCDLRYDILGSTDVAPSNYGSSDTNTTVGYDPSETCTTNPVPNTLMAALPADLRAIMKPMIKYTCISNSADAQKTIDYLPLLSEMEVRGSISYSYKFGGELQKRYAYYTSGKSTIKYKHSDTATKMKWVLRAFSSNNAHPVSVYISEGQFDNGQAHTSYGLAPIFKV